MELELEHRQKQELRLTPMLLQAMEILQMNVTDLQTFLSGELQSNPVLEGEPGPAADMDAAALSKKLEWINGQPQRRAASLGDDPVASAAELMAAPRWDETLEAHLLLQLRELAVTKEERICVRYLIGCVDARGYLREDAAEVADRLRTSTAAAERALAMLRAMDPPGICAAGLRECLLAQLRRMPGSELAERIVTQQLEALAADKLSAVAKALEVSVKKVEAAAALIRSLDPAPGAPFSNSGQTHYVVPDVFVRREGDGFVVTLNNALLPELSISAFYAALQRDDPGGEVQEYLNTQLQRARWIINGVHQRQETLLQCANAVVELQRDYFLGSTASLRPMSMNDVAQVIGMHPSTVSRAVKDKYLQCARGVLPMKALFVRSLSGEDGASSDLAKRRIAALVSGEDPRKPLSDQKLCDALAAEDIPLSRRTVAKYREALHIPGSAQRRREG